MQPKVPLPSPPTLASMQKAYVVVRSQAYRTSIQTNAEISEITQRLLSDVAGASGCPIPRIKLFFKCENFQRSGSFKFRGAVHFLSQLDDKALRRGIITYSTGNHAIALTQAAKALSEVKGFHIPVEVLMSWTASPDKIKIVESYGGKATLHGPTLTECALLAETIEQETGATLVPPSGHPNIVSGQGTAMLEFHEQMEELDERPLDVVIVPSAGGALLAGTAVACQGLDHNISVFAAEPKEGGANLAQGIREGRRTTKLTSFTIADGLRSRVGLCNWEVVSNQEFVKGVYSATDDEIRKAMLLIIDKMKILIEPSSAVPVAVLLFNKEFQQVLLARHGGKQLNIGVVLTGGNLSLKTLHELYDNGKAS